jgi:hypothetical protein
MHFSILYFLFFQPFPQISDRLSSGNPVAIANFGRKSSGIAE